MDFSVVHEDSYMLVFTVNDSPRAVVFFRLFAILNYSM